MPRTSANHGKHNRFTQLLRRIQVTGIPKDDLEALRWLLGLRNRVASMLLVMLLTFILIPAIPRPVIFSLAGIDLLFFGVNSLYGWLVKGKPSARRMQVLRQVMMPVDMLIDTIAIYLSGGALSPLFITYPISILISIILLDPKGVYRTAGMGVVLYCALALSEVWGVLPAIDIQWGTLHYQEVASPQTYAMYVLAVGSMIMVAGYMGNRIALSLGQRNRQIESQFGDLRTLYTITEGLAGMMDEDEISRYLADTLKTLQNATMCIVALAGHNHNREIRAVAGLAPELLEKLRDVYRSMPQASIVAGEGCPLILKDIDQHPKLSTLLAGTQARSACVLPVKTNEEVLGSISLIFNDCRSLNPEYLELLTAIAAQAAAALQRARLFANTRRLARQMSTLYDAGLYTGSTLSGEEVLRRISSTIQNLLEPDAYYIALHDQAHNRLDVEVLVEYGRALPGMHLSLDTGSLTRHIIESRQPLMIHDWRSDGHKFAYIAKKVGQDDMLSYLGVPMMSEGRVIGVISVQSKRPMAFDASHERLLMALAAQTAMALENARLHRLAQDQARLDSLTQVYNHGYFISQLHQAVETSDKNDTQISLIMLDIDYFKHYNDSYGHVAGDNVLRMVANALKSSIRDCDFVGRWGGEEFGVLLVGAGIPEAKKVARSIQYAVSVLYPVDAYGRVIPNPTVSQGISSYPHPSATANDLIEDADVALYYAKMQGRNQLVVYEQGTSMKETRYTTSNLSGALRSSSSPSSSSSSSSPSPTSPRLYRR
jgi:diguanylate cyclase (GGDEF)-like protein